MKPPMRFAAVTALLAALPAILLRPSTAAAQEPATPPPVQSARPLNLPTLRPPVADTGIFSPLPLPPANEMRRPDGAPGRAYWQQRVDYRIRATLDTSTARITGMESIRYRNNSPDTLRFLWLHLEQNLFRPGSVGTFLFPTDSGPRAEFEGGFEIDSLVQCTVPDERQAPAAVKRRRRSRTPVSPPPRCPGGALKTRVEETLMYVDLAAPIPPSGSTILEIAYRFTVPVRGADRMGREGSLYQIAQWYPRLAVYDDVQGWNTAQYLGQGEFYLEYGNFEYEVTVPAGYIVAGTGVLQNPGDVLTRTQRQRLAAARGSDTTVRIITSAELVAGAARPVRDGALTWRFKADNVRDVAWAASPEYVWDATGWQGILAQAYYRPSAEDTWRDAARMTRYSIQEYSTRWYSYPYPQISSVEGPVPGMEYPMLAMQPKENSGPDLYAVLTHEVGHMWYPMIVGSDEQRHAWMDEGFTSFIGTFSEEGYWQRSDATVRQRERQLMIATDQLPTAQPVMTPADRYRTRDNLLSLAYVKPSLALHTLRNKVLGPQAFDTAFREYTRRWAFKHPQPTDFFRTIESVAGRDLAWFWRGFFYTTAALDQAVESVKQDTTGASQVTLVSLGDAVMPVELELAYEDATAEVVKLPVEIWYPGNRYVYLTNPGKTIVAARVNPDGTLPDAVATNDGWKRAAPAATP